MKQEILENHTLGDLKCEWTHRTEPGKEQGWHIFNSETLITIGDGQQAGINANFICHAVNCHEQLVAALIKAKETIENLATKENYSSARWKNEHLLPIANAIQKATA